MTTTTNGENTKIEIRKLRNKKKLIQNHTEEKVEEVEKIGEGTICVATPIILYHTGY